jgi:hypothetical protein
MSSEGARLSGLMSDARACMAATALARARAIYGGGPCASCGPATAAAGPQVGPESTALADKAARCVSVGYTSPYVCVPESVRVQRTQIEAVDCHAAAGPYPKVFPVACPPTRYSLLEYDGSGNVIGYQPMGPNTPGLEPIKQGITCPLPNKPYNPVLPG